MLKQYFESFFENDIEKAVFNTSCNSPKYKNSEVSDWLNTENRFKSYLPYGNLDSFYVEIGETCSFFIKKLFEKYVDDNTFVIGSPEHQNIYLNMQNSQNKMNLTYKIVKDFDTDILIQKYKESNCKRLFVYGTGILETNIVPQSFYIKLKNALIEQSIEHILILDDVQSMFIVPRDYSIFDYVLSTCHALVPNFNSGILLSKKSEQFGYSDADILNSFLDALEVILSKRNKLYLFNLVLKQYLAEEILKEDLFSVPNNSTLNVFYLYIKDERIKQALNKYQEELQNYGIKIGGNTIVIRAGRVLHLEPDYIVEGLEKLKKILQKCIKLKDRI